MLPLKPTTGSPGEIRTPIEGLKALKFPNYALKWKIKFPPPKQNPSHRTVNPRFASSVEPRNMYVR